MVREGGRRREVRRSRGCESDCAGIARKSISQRYSTRPLSGTQTASCPSCSPSQPAGCLDGHLGWRSGHLPRRGLYEVVRLRTKPRRGRAASQGAGQIGAEGADLDRPGSPDSGVLTILLLLLQGFPGLPEEEASRLTQDGLAITPDLASASGFHACQQPCSWTPNSGRR